MKNVKAAVCVKCGAEFEAGKDTYTCAKCGGVLEIVLDYDYIKTQISREKFAEKKIFPCGATWNSFPLRKAQNLALYARAGHPCTKLLR